MNWMGPALRYEDLDASQRQALSSSVDLIEAGPGAGKTRTVIARMSQQQSKLEKAVALISFTNVAAEEAKRRCGPDMLAFPHYVGTFDAFLHRYLVTPDFIRVRGEVPQYVLSWNDMPEHLAVIRIKGVTGRGVNLETFKLHADGSVALPGAVPYRDRAYVQSVTKAAKVDQLVARGAQIIQGLISRGILDSDAARLEALRILEDFENPVTQRLAARFGEIIIDEFQDCSELEVRIVGALKELGVKVVAVADPDQAIYEFRDASPESYKNFRAELPSEAVVSLETSYRSTPAICSFISALRSVSATKIKSNRPSDSREIIVAAGTPERQREIFEEQLVLNGIAQHDSMILAHGRKAALELAGQEVLTGALSASSSKTFTILRSIMELSNSGTARARKDAITRCERALLALVDWAPADKQLPHSEQLSTLGVERSDVVAFLLQLRKVSVEWGDLEEATLAIREYVSNHFARRERPLRNVNRSLVKLQQEQWSHWTKRKTVSEADSILPNSHIHGVKGMEYRAVMLSVEKQRREEPLWEIDPSVRSTEALRVLYVGASRAEELLVLACKPKEVAALSQFLYQATVPFELVCR